MGFRGASRFVAQLANTEGGTWGWDNTEEMEQCIRPHPLPQIELHDALQRCQGQPPAFQRDSELQPQAGAKVWALLDNVWVASQVVKVGKGDDVEVRELPKGKAKSIPRECLRPNPVWETPVIGQNARAARRQAQNAARATRADSEDDDGSDDESSDYSVE